MSINQGRTTLATLWSGFKDSNKPKHNCENELLRPDYRVRGADDDILICLTGTPPSLL